MPSTTFLTSIALLAAAISPALLAGEREHAQRRDRPQSTQQQAMQKATADSFDHAMQAVQHDAAAPAPGHGWRYFTDPAARRAVVISPQGDYYYSRGKGLHWVAAEQI